jgi:hypothetical protein
LEQIGTLWIANNVQEVSKSTSRQEGDIMSLSKPERFSLPGVLDFGRPIIDRPLLLPQPVRTNGTAITKGDGSGGFTAAIAGVDYASPEQAAHTGGVIGTASFKAADASISNLVHDGVITGVDYCESGRFTINLSGQSNANYIALASLGGNGADDTWSYNIPASDKQTASFTIEVRFKGSKSDESDNIQVAVIRLSQ